MDASMNWIDVEAGNEWRRPFWLEWAQKCAPAAAPILALEIERIQALGKRPKFCHSFLQFQPWSEDREAAEMAAYERDRIAYTKGLEIIHTEADEALLAIDDESVNRFLLPLRTGAHTEDFVNPMVDEDEDGCPAYRPRLTESNLTVVNLASGIAVRNIAVRKGDGWCVAQSEKRELVGQKMCGIQMHKVLRVATGEDDLIRYASDSVPLAIHAWNHARIERTIDGRALLLSEIMEMF